MKYYHHLVLKSSTSPKLLPTDSPCKMIFNFPIGLLNLFIAGSKSKIEMWVTGEENGIFWGQKKAVHRQSAGG